MFTLDFLVFRMKLFIFKLSNSETKTSLKKPPPAEISEQLKSWKYKRFYNAEKESLIVFLSLTSDVSTKTFNQMETYFVSYIIAIKFDISNHID